MRCNNESLQLYFYNLIYSNSCLLAVYRLWKYFYGLFTNSTELYRICQNELLHTDINADHLIVSCKTIADIERQIVYSKQLTVRVIFFFFFFFFSRITLSKCRSIYILNFRRKKIERRILSLVKAKFYPFFTLIFVFFFSTLTFF
ncbi:hypothetical protein HMI55_005980 [Coelomomyces lativittatus]|nr:hypothetical protein HMI55_005980 [Coelomomyces lativittatus]